MFTQSHYKNKITLVMISYKWQRKECKMYWSLYYFESPITSNAFGGNWTGCELDVIIYRFALVTVVLNSTSCECLRGEYTAATLLLWWVGQKDDHLWHALRKGRLTARHFGRVLMAILGAWDRHHRGEVHIPLEGPYGVEDSMQEKSFYLHQEDATCQSLGTGKLMIQNIQGKQWGSFH